MIISIMITMTLASLLSENWDTIFQAIVVLCALIIVVSALHNMGMLNPIINWKEREKKFNELWELTKAVNFNVEVLRRQHNLILHKLDPKQVENMEEHVNEISSKTGLPKTEILKVVEMLQQKNDVKAGIKQ